jgi:hypothetical protein
VSPGNRPESRRRLGEELRFKAVLFLLCLVLFSAFCGQQRTEDDAVLEVFDSLSRLAEQKDLEGMMAFFAEDFRDFEGRDKKELRSLISSYLGGRTGVVVQRLSSRILAFEGGQAEFEADVALSSGGAEALRRFVRVSPDIYRIRIELVKEDGVWLIGSAEWAGIPLTEILPESLSVLKKLYPKL